MASKSKPPKGDTPSTYMVLESKKKAEIRRLVLQDHLITTAMGGVLAEQADPSIFHRLLDVGCGPGGWMVETAQMYPEMHLVGLDINPQMLEYAREQVNAHHLKERVEFREKEAPVAAPSLRQEQVHLRQIGWHHALSSKWICCSKRRWCSGLPAHDHERRMGTAYPSVHSSDKTVSRVSACLPPA